MSATNSATDDGSTTAASVDLQGLLGRPARVMVTKIGLDGHDRGSRLVAGFLRDAGMEVIYTAPWQAIETVVNQAMEEDVDAIGISSLATDHLLVPKLMEAMRAAKLDDVVVIVGGIVPGMIAATVCYYLCIPLVRAYQNRRKGALIAKLAAIKHKATRKADRP